MARCFHNNIIGGITFAELRARVFVIIFMALMPLDYAA